MGGIAAPAPKQPKTQSLVVLGKQVQVVKLKFPDWYYPPSPEILSLCSDLRLVSKDRYVFDLNLALFATVSTLPGQCGWAQELQESMCTIITEIDRDDLEMVVKFVLAGLVPLNVTPAIYETFSSMGISLNQLSFLQVDPTKLDKPYVDISKSLDEVQRLERERSKTLKIEWCMGLYVPASGGENGAKKRVSCYLLQYR